MKKGLFLFAILFAGLAQGAKITEEFFRCSHEGSDRLAKIFIDPEIFCDNEREHKARLLLSKDGEAKIYDGALYRWDSGKGESFVYPHLAAHEGKKLTLTLPYGISTGVLAETYEGQTTHVMELKCVTRQIHVSCD